MYTYNISVSEPKVIRSHHNRMKETDQKKKKQTKENQTNNQTTNKIY